MNMKKVSLVLVLGLFASSAQADSVDCDALYESRADLSQVAKAFDCYAERAEASKDVERRRSLEGQMLASVWLINKSRPAKDSDDTAEKKAMRRGYIDRSLPQAIALAKEFPDSGSGYYWRAVFVSFDCGEAGFGAKGIQCIFSRLPQVNSDLENAMKLDPGYHGGGSERVMAYMHFEKSKWAQSTVARALEYAKKANQRAPLCTLNSIVLAKMLIASKLKTEAKTVLNQLLSLDPKNPAQVDPAFVQEAIDDQVDARALLEQI